MARILSRAKRGVTSTREWTPQTSRPAQGTPLSAWRNTHYDGLLLRDLPFDPQDIS
jgi:hypothetical protein